MIFNKSLNTLLLTTTVIFLSVVNNIYCQDEYKRSAIKLGIGFGINEGREERGEGLVYLVGWQREFGQHKQLRFNPYMMMGGFQTFPLVNSTDDDQLYRITSVGINMHYDLFQYKSIALVTTGGGFFNYTRGLFTQPSEYFQHYYFGASTSLALRIDKKKLLAVEIRPVNFQIGNNGFLTGYVMFNMDIRFRN